MANKPIKAIINVSKILKEHMFKGEKGTYLDLVIWPNKDGLDQFGNTHSIQQDIPKAARDAGVKAPYIGSLRMPEDEAPSRPTSQPSATEGGEEDLVPF